MDKMIKKHRKERKERQMLENLKKEYRIKLIKTKKEIENFIEQQIRKTGLSREEIIIKYNLQQFINMYNEEFSKLAKELYNKIRFNDLFEHFKYLKEKQLYDIEFKDNSIIVNNKIIIKACTKKSLFHGTNLINAQNIIKCGFFKNDNYDINDFHYNKTFFTPNELYAMYFGNISSDKSDYYIVFKVNLSNYVVYDSFFEIEDIEYFVWGEVNADDIENIYLCKDFNIIKEISKEELLKLEV